MPKAMFKPTESFVTVNPETGDRELFHDAMVVTDGHWVLKGREALFVPVDDVAKSGEVETATAAPGEKRTTKRSTAKG